VPRLRVEAGSWLIEHEHLRLVHERPSDHETSLHSARQFFGVCVASVLELEQRERLVDV
jgi:hypothetical protein